MSKESKSDKFKRERDQVIKERDLIIQENKELKIELAKRTEEFQSTIADITTSAQTIIRRVQEVFIAGDEEFKVCPECHGAILKYEINGETNLEESWTCADESCGYTE